MAENQEITITFTAQTTAVLAAGTLSQNRVQAVGHADGGRRDPDLHRHGLRLRDLRRLADHEDLELPPTPLYPGDRFTYTVTVTNPAGRRRP